VEEFVGVPVAMVGVGPGRDDVIWTRAGESTATRRLAAAAG
jgi:adenylosuccinate synthase